MEVGDFSDILKRLMSDIEVSWDGASLIMLEGFPLYIYPGEDALFTLATPVFRHEDAEALAAAERRALESNASELYSRGASFSLAGTDQQFLFYERVARFTDEPGLVATVEEFFDESRSAMALFADLNDGKPNVPPDRTEDSEAAEDADDGSQAPLDAPRGEWGGNFLKV